MTTDEQYAVNRARSTMIQAGEILDGLRAEVDKAKSIYWDTIKEYEDAIRERERSIANAKDKARNKEK